MTVQLKHQHLEGAEELLWILDLLIANKGHIVETCETNFDKVLSYTMISKCGDREFTLDLKSGLCDSVSLHHYDAAEVLDLINRLYVWSEYNIDGSKRPIFPVSTPIKHRNDPSAIYQLYRDNGFAMWGMDDYGNNRWQYIEAIHKITTEQIQRLNEE